jgi:protein SCO1/2
MNDRKNRGGLAMTNLKPILSSLLVLALAAAGLTAGQAAAADKDEHAAHRRMAAKAADARNVSVQLHDLELRDQFGKPVKFKSDVIGDRLVAITFTYSTCTTICPVYSALFAGTQALLGERMEREAVLVTMTLDPATDVPLRLKREAEKYRARPGWYFLTGEKKNVDQVLKGLDAYFPDFTQHPPMALIGDGLTGTWRRYNGFPEPEKIVAMMDELRAARNSHGHAGHH